MTSLVRMDRLFGEFLWYIVLNGSDDFLMLMQYMSMMVMMTIAMKQTIKGSFLLGLAKAKIYAQNGH